MAKKKRKEEKKLESMPSQYGSHRSMIIPRQPENLKKGMVICADEYGQYETYEDRLDSKMADPRRWDRDAVRQGVV